jgi:hypothetical protein
MQAYSMQQKVFILEEFYKSENSVWNFLYVMEH